MTVRGQPACTGYVIGFNLSPEDPSTINWRVKIQTGPHAGSKATIDRDHVPRGIRRGQDIRFDVVDVDGSLVAVNAVIEEQPTR